MPYTNLPIEAPTPGPRAFNRTYHSANGFRFQVDQLGNGNDSTAVFPAQALPWIEAALNACSFDVERLWAVHALWDHDVFNQGAGAELTLRFYPAKKENLPDFPDDFVRVEYQTAQAAFSEVSIYIWEGLIGAQLPFGGRLFFQETAIHGLGHAVGGLLAVGLDLFKRKRIVTALMSDIILRRESWEVPYGYGVAWQMWDNGNLPSTPWNERPIERYAEAFKDIYMLPSQRRFVNRTRTPKVDVVAVRAETHNYLPINGVDLPPHPAEFFFLGMSFQMRIQPAKSLPVGCMDRLDGGIQFVCYDPTSGAKNECFPCGGGTYDPRDPKVCNQSWAAPLSTMATMGIGTKTRVPQIKLCDPCLVWIGAPRTFDIIRPRTYDCPGEEGVGAKFVPPGFGRLPNWADGAHFSIDVNLGKHVVGEGVLRHKGGGAWYDEGGKPITIGRGGDALYAHGMSDFGVSLVLQPTYEGYDGTAGAADVSVSLGGYCEPFNISPGDSFDFMADPLYLAAGYMHFPPYETYISAPSDGGATNPYSQLNLDGVDQGIYKAPIAVGAESVSPDLETRQALTGFGASSLTIGGT